MCTDSHVTEKCPAYLLSETEANTLLHVLGGKNNHINYKVFPWTSLHASSTCGCFHSLVKPLVESQHHIVLLL